MGGPNFELFNGQGWVGIFSFVQILRDRSGQFPYKRDSGSRRNRSWIQKILLVSNIATFGTGQFGGGLLLLDKR